MNRPYYIVAPSYTSRSGGVMALYVLCNKLNIFGEKAYILPMSYSDDFVISPYLDTPLATKAMDKYFKQEDMEPIVIYPDIIKGNPYNAKNILRLMLAEPGLFGGEKEFSHDEMIWSFSKNIASKTRNPENIISICVTDTNIYKPGNYERRGNCFFSNKYDRIHSNKLLPITMDATRLAGTRNEMIELLQKSEICYVYENSVVSVESILCGCPVILIKTPYFNESWLHDEYGWDGVRWSDEERWGNIELAEKNYKKLYIKFIYEQLPKFIKYTQDFFS